MIRANGNALLLASAGALLAACATLPQQTAVTEACRNLFADLDDRVERAGARDAGATRVPGFPYLRTDRFLAHFGDYALDQAQFDLWVRYLRLRDLDSRFVELENLGAANRHDLLIQAEACGKDLVRLELDDPESRELLRRAVEVPDDYSLLARALGFYPLAVPFLNRGIEAYHAEVKTDFETPLHDLEHPGELISWHPRGERVPEEEAQQLVRDAPRNALGIPEFDPQQWWALARFHAPVWWIETGGDHDRPVVPVFHEGRIALDPSIPMTFFQPSYTRFGAHVLPALVYTVWFPSRPAGSRFDPYAGSVDGLIWRVTLDPEGRPLVYDTIHSCGCYRYTFPAQDLERTSRAGFWQEPALFPQDRIPRAPLALRIQSGTHYLRRVTSADGIDADRPAEYFFAPYDALLTIPGAPDGSSGSLFDERGMVEGSERLERFWLWPTGVKSPGAMRQWGRHATSFVGRNHFDDARRLEQNFVVPEWAR